MHPDKCLRLNGPGSADGQHRDPQGEQAEGVRRTERRPVTRKKVRKVREKGRFLQSWCTGQGKDSGFFRAWGKLL